MSQPTAKSLADLSRKLSMLVMEARGTPIAARIEAYVARHAQGRKVSQFLADSSLDATERASVAGRLVEILLQKDYTRLPELAPAEQPVAAPDARPTPQPPAETPADDLDGFTPAQIARIEAIVRRQVGIALGAVARVMTQ